MIQSQSLGGPPADSGGSAKGGDGNRTRRPISGHPIPRQEGADARVHRHDSRDSGPISAAREWRRPSRGHDISRRDDRGFKDRRKERKRWEKPRIRDSIRDPRRENARDPPRDTIFEYERGFGLKSYKGLTRESSTEPPRVNRSQPLFEHNRSRISYEDERRDSPKSSTSITSAQLNPTPIQPKTTIGNDQSKGPRKFTRPPGDKLRDLLMGTVKTKRPTENSAHKPISDSKDSSSDDHAESQLKPSHLMEAGHLEDSIPLKPECTDSTNSTSKAMDTPSSEDPHVNGAEESRQLAREDSRDFKDFPDSGDSPPAKPQEWKVDSTNSESRASQYTEDVKPAQSLTPKDETTDRDAKPDGSTVTKIGLSEGQLRVSKECENPAVVEFAKDELQLPEADDAPESEEGFMDAERSNGEIQESEPNNKALKVAKAIPLLPQERQLQESLAEKFIAISSLVMPGKVQQKSWSLFPVTPSVAATIYQHELQAKTNIKSRVAEFEALKEAWAKQATYLDDLSRFENPEVETKSGSGSQASIKPQPPAVSNHSRKKSREEESTSSSANRRNRERHSRAHGDVARSEAEFLEILASLEAETARDPLVRARLTSARIPDQCQSFPFDHFCSTNAIVKDHSTLLDRLNGDAVDAFTEEQHINFIEAYIKWPKEFGKIGEAIGCSFNDCVMHYYRTKKLTDYKKILSQRNKKKRGRKPRKRTDETSKAVAHACATAPETSQFEHQFPNAADEDEIISSSAGTPAALSVTGDSSIETPELRKPTAPSEEMPINGFENQRNFLNKSMETDAAQDVVGSARMPMKGTFTEPAHVVPEPTIAVPASNVPPPVLPLHQMETLADVAFTESTRWTGIDIKLFEELFKIFGLNFAEIARHLRVPVEDIKQFLNFNYAYFEGLLRSLQTYREINGAAPLTTNPPLHANSVQASSSPDGQAYKATQYGKNPVLPPKFSALQAPSGAQMYDIQHSTRSHVPRPVLPLDRSHTPRMEGSDEDTIISVTHQAILPPIPSPPNDTIKPGAKFLTSELQIWPEFAQPAPVIPPVLPRTKKGSTFRKIYGSEYSFTGFDESNERN